MRRLSWLTAGVSLLLIASVVTCLLLTSSALWAADSYVARSIKGVRSVVNMLEIKAIERTDRQIRRDVRDALGDDPVTDSLQIGVEVDSENIKVTVEDGVATLMGIVDSLEERKKAEEIALYGGANRVINKLKVMPRSR